MCVLPMCAVPVCVCVCVCAYVWCVLFSYVLCPCVCAGMVCGVQSSLQACFEMLSFLAGVYLQDPKLFYWLMLGSLGFVACAAFLDTVFAIRQTCRQGDRGTRRPQT